MLQSDPRQTAKRKGSTMIRSITVLSMALCLNRALTAQTPRRIDDSQCRTSCGAVVLDSFALRFPDDMPLPGLPRLIRGTRRGQYVVIPTRNALTDGPPLVFDAKGGFVSHLGRKGRGPGESEHPDWLDADLDDSIRVIENARLTVFGPDLRLAASSTMSRWITGPMFVVAFAPDRFVALGSGAMRPGEPRRFEIIGSASAASTLKFVPTRHDASAGALQVLARARNALSPWLWVARFSLSDGFGYDLEKVGNQLGGSWRRRPEWWVSKHLSPATNTPPLVSRLADVREIAPARVALLVAQPSGNARRRSAPIKPRTGAGWWNRYDAVVEVVDIDRGELVAHLELPGFPRQFVADDRIAVYSEVDDEPRIQIVRIRFTP